MGGRRRPRRRRRRSISLFDLPCRVVRDVQGEIAAGARELRHRLAGERFTPRDPLVLSGSAGDDMGAAAHLRL